MLRNLTAGALLVVGGVLAAGVFCRAEDAPAAPATAGYAEQGRVAMTKGVAFMLGKQLPDGSWLQHPAVTALAISAIVNSPEGKAAAATTAIGRGLDFILTFAHEDGSIWNDKRADEYPNYTTAISLIALVQVNRVQDQAVIRKARDYLIGSQFADAAEGVYVGGIGYGKKKRPDLSNTQWALEALYVSDHLDREPFNADPEKAKKSELAWEKALAFLGNCQNLPETNKQAWVVSDPGNRGGFVYMPGESKAGEVESEDGGKGLRSYGSMTYAGLKSMIYARLAKDDPRVQAAVAWIGQNWTFAENPGMADAGLYYYLQTCAKALAALGSETVADQSGAAHRWREELVGAVVKFQQPDGQWANQNGRWMESIPELATAYSLLALEAALPVSAPAPAPAAVTPAAPAAP